MKATLLITLALALAGCGSDAPIDVAAPVAPITVVPVDVATVGADLALPASAAASAGAAAVDPLAELAELAPPDTTSTATVTADLLPPA